MSVALEGLEHADPVVQDMNHALQAADASVTIQDKDSTLRNHHTSREIDDVVDLHEGDAAAHEQVSEEIDRDSSLANKIPALDSFNGDAANGTGEPHPPVSETLQDDILNDIEERPAVALAESAHSHAIDEHAPATSDVLEQRGELGSSVVTSAESEQTDAAAAAEKASSDEANETTAEIPQTAAQIFSAAEEQHNSSEEPETQQEEAHEENASAAVDETVAVAPTELVATEGEAPTEETAPTKETALAEESEIPGEPNATEEITTGEGATPVVEAAATEEVDTVTEDIAEEAGTGDESSTAKEASAEEIVAVEEAIAAGELSTAEEAAHAEKPAAEEEAAPTEEIVVAEQTSLSEERAAAERRNSAQVEETAREATPAPEESTTFEERAPAAEAAVVSEEVAAPVEISTEEPAHPEESVASEELAPQETSSVGETVTVEQEAATAAISEEKQEEEAATATETPVEELTAVEEAIVVEEQATVEELKPEEIASIEEIPVVDVVATDPREDAVTLEEATQSEGEDVGERVPAAEQFATEEPVAVQVTEMNPVNGAEAVAVEEDTPVAVTADVAEVLTEAGRAASGSTEAASSLIAEGSVAEAILAEATATYEPDTAVAGGEEPLSAAVEAAIVTTEAVPEAPSELPAVDGEAQPAIVTSEEVTDIEYSGSAPIETAVANTEVETSIPAAKAQEQPTETLVEVVQAGEVEQAGNNVAQPGNEAAQLDEKHVPAAYVDADQVASREEAPVVAEESATAAKEDAQEGSTGVAHHVLQAGLATVAGAGVQELAAQVPILEHLDHDDAEDAAVVESHQVCPSSNASGTHRSKRIQEQEVPATSIISAAEKAVPEAGISVVEEDATPAVTIDVSEDIAGKVVEQDNLPAAEGSLPAAATETERPKSPWTPSYSVTRQGSGVDADADEDKEEIAELEQLPPPANEAQAESSTVEETAIAVPVIRAEIVDVLTEEPSAMKVSIVEDATETTEEEAAKPTWVRSYSVSSQGTSPVHSPKLGPTEAAEEPPKATWVRSYSVSSQGGSPLHSPKPLDEAAADANSDEQVVEAEAVQITISPAPETEVVGNIAFAQESVPSVVSATEDTVSDVNIDGTAADVITDEAGEEGKSASWVPSYSVNSLGTSPLQIARATEDADVEGLAPLPAMVASESTSVQTDFPVVETTIIEVVEEASPDILASNAQAAPQLSVDVSTVTTKDAERPKSPWTPSYSVTRQGTSPLNGPIAMEEKELDQLEQLPAPVTQAEEQAETAVREIVTEVIVQKQLSTNNDGLVVGEPPARPWTPSYSVTTQGPGTPKAVGVIEASETQASKPELTPLTTANGEQQDQATQGEPKSPSTRARNGSNTSSRFFPGGWFSSSSKSPHHAGRLSHENAEGEFSKSSTSALASPALETTANAANGDVGERRKSRWCIVM
ncbi:uncharacterized protein LAESUDRAFT_811890 [Laetiporus sulphureus 93-53]|uniref:Uncharacterized protein n=1 Tax=Laetiporus sulphureus 93-53 TaxID=1314785 RepID=A0A165ERM8_9APHY|nr:uncharacterized protein LAESUDRAFT_811890 [Laetiporus sulphureus 93-53]KZT07623.1 hypothetical protein LAESUDRAFT_811890 [Laetiporus sulphureus 93-53]